MGHGGSALIHREEVKLVLYLIRIKREGVLWSDRDEDRRGIDVPSEGIYLGIRCQGKCLRI